MNQNYARLLECIHCHKQYPVDSVDYTCPDCGTSGNLTVIYDYAALKKYWSKKDLENNRNYSHWRYLPLLPINNPDLIPPLQVGWTPLYHYPKLAEAYECNDLMIKDDGRGPTASLKDRPSSLAVVKAREMGASLITCASTGNAASSLACACASVGLSSVIFVPERAPQAKVAQLLAFGAKVIMVKGSYDQAFDLCLKATEKFGWYSRNTGFNPYLREGKKTFALELCEQNNWIVPDLAFVSVGDGNTFSAGWKAFRELYELGWIDKLPRMIAVQAEGASPLVKAFLSHQPIQPEIADTLADSIAVGNPRDGEAALNAILESKGDGITVTDNQILDAIRYLARKAGIFAEPAGAAAFAGFLKYIKTNPSLKDKSVAIMVTGNGLKDIQGVMKAVSERPLLVEPDESSLELISRSV